MNTLEKAQNVSARARTFAEGEKERAERQQIASMLGQVEAEVRNLTHAVAAFRTAQTAGVPVLWPSTNIDTGLATLQERLGQGLPTPQALVSARDRLRSHASAVTECVASAWRSWAEARIRNAQLGRLNLLPFHQRTRAEELVRRLRSAASPSSASEAVISQFLRDLATLERLLDAVDTRGPLVLLIERVKGGRVTLADLSAEEIELLTSTPDVAMQIELRLT